jgi:hypothetical protein
LNFKEYQRRALETESKPTELNFGEIGLHIMLNASIVMAELMNQTKRTMFYGKPLDGAVIRGLAEDLGGYAQLIFEMSDKLAEKNDKAAYNALPEEARNIKPENLNLRIAHSGIGIFTEAGEGLELIRDMLEGKPFDSVGWGEEIGGDVSWYQAIGHDAAGTDEDVERAKNIAKLELRNKGKVFNAEATLNRDAEAERAILEGKPA